MFNVGNLIGFIIFFLIIPIQILFLYIQYRKIIPVVQTKRALKIWEYLPGTHQWGITIEYKRICSIDDDSYKWYKIQKLNMTATIVLGLLLLLLFIKAVILPHL